MIDDKPDLPEEPPILIGDLVIPRIKYAYAFSNDMEFYLPQIPMLVINDSDYWEDQYTACLYDGSSTGEWVMIMVPEHGIICTRRIMLKVVS